LSYGLLTESGVKGLIKFINRFSSCPSPVSDPPGSGESPFSIACDAANNPYHIPPEFKPSLKIVPPAVKMNASGFAALQKPSLKLS